MPCDKAPVGLLHPVLHAGDRERAVHLDGGRGAVGLGDVGFVGVAVGIGLDPVDRGAGDGGLGGGGGLVGVGPRQRRLRDAVGLVRAALPVAAPAVAGVGLDAGDGEVGVHLEGGFGAVGLGDVGFVRAAIAVGL